MLLLTLVVGIVGLPVPAWTPKTSDERFPCETCPCGCSSAEYCWDRCCCFTDTEKLAWAVRNSVTPPAFLVSRVVDQLYLADETCCGKPSHSLASGQPSSSSCSVSRQSACCSSASKQCGGKDLQKDNSLEDDTPKVRVVLLDKALECRGITTAFVLFKSVWVLEPSQDFTPQHPRIVAWFTHQDEALLSRSDPPDSPVPWVLFS
ncbi:hypothetical protein FF011L_31780 [Roseimaritima multifibrata]|uniref:Uncharacterized protein n=1 Tax=Roseimaritima multifibrata TaxID=1930274 RepID=A0A517MHP5_9BACT|nr:hypothetical protein FF011L_31780 [Roseimaritima multifibrata]